MFSLRRFTMLLKKPFIFFLLPINLFAQSGTEKDCGSSTLFGLTENEIIYSKKNATPIHLDIKNNLAIPFNDYNKKSFWYEFTIENDCEFSFNIYPYQIEDTYNFFLYKDPNPAQNDFCEQLVAKNIAPHRANLFKMNMFKKGTGLAPKAIIGYTDTTKLTKELLYNRSHHNSVEAKKGEVYYLNIYHTRGEDCGHLFEIAVNNVKQNYRVLHDRCLGREKLKVVELEKKEIAIKKQEERKVLPPPKPVEKAFQAIIVYGKIHDSISNKEIEAVINCVNRKTKSKMTFNVPAGNNFNVVLNEPGNYEITCTSLGYKDKSLLFFADGDEKSMEFNFQMVSLKAGDNFALRNIYFYPNTYAFIPESKKGLEELYQFMIAQTSAKIEIGGHTNGRAKVKANPMYSNRGPEWNFSGNEKKLSKLRAEAVKVYLKTKGITEERILTEGYGAEKMLFPTPETIEESDLNKRVEIKILSMGSENQ